MGKTKLGSIHGGQRERACWGKMGQLTDWEDLKTLHHSGLKITVFVQYWWSLETVCLCLSHTGSGPVFSSGAHLLNLSSKYPYMTLPFHLAMTATVTAILCSSGVSSHLFPKDSSLWERSYEGSIQLTTLLPQAKIRHSKCKMRSCLSLHWLCTELQGKVQKLHKIR